MEGAGHDDPGRYRSRPGRFRFGCRAGAPSRFEWLELHFAHGFLAQSFLSRYSNERDDRYGGSFENRTRFILETIAAVLKVWPQDLPLSVRLGVIEYDGRDDEALTEAIALIRLVRPAGMDLVSVSLGFSTVAASIPWGAAFMAPVTERVRRGTGLPVDIAWGMGTPKLAEGAVRDGKADLVKIGQALLANPHWPYFAAAALRVDRPSWETLPASYARWLECYQPEQKAAMA